MAARGMASGRESREKIDVPEWTHQMFWQCLFVGVGTFVVDFLWARYILSIGERSAGLSAVWSASIVFVSAATTIVYVGNPWTVGAAVVGAAGGTYLSVRRVK